MWHNYSPFSANYKSGKTSNLIGEISHPNPGNNDETSDRFAAIDTQNKYTKYTFTNLSPVTAASSQAPATVFADHDLGLWELLQ